MENRNARSEKSQGKPYKKKRRYSSNASSSSESGGKSSRNRFQGNRKRNNSGGNNGGRGRNTKRKTNTIPVHKLVHQGTALEDVAYTPNKMYKEFPLHPDLLQNILNLGYTAPTEIQERSFEPILELKNLIAIANTGTGKTASFLIPLINALLFEEDEKFATLVMVPTRELALQVEDEFKKISKGLNLFSTCVIGGQSINNDLKRLRKPNQFIIGTPGRLVDLAKRKAINFDDFSVLVLDEFDRMLDMGFSQDVNFITSKMRHRDQTLLFSATINQEQKEIIRKLVPEHIIIKVTDGTTTAEHIDQDVVYSNRDNKFDLLLGMLRDKGFEKVLVFAETKRNVGKITRNLKNSKIKVDEIHGDKSQNYRKNALQAFKKGKINVLVATDVAARGLDIKDVTHVINYQIPQDYETYIHRIGRTGRAGKKGKAFTFVEGSKPKS